MRDSRQIEFGNGELIVISETGENHIKNGSCNQDSFSHLCNGNSYGFALADGVSTCAKCKEGADYAVKIIVDLIDNINTNDINEIKTQIFKTWKNHFKNNWNQYGSTLNFCYLYSSKIVLGKIGDGMVLLKQGTDIKVLKENQDFYTNETFALGETLPKSAFDVEVIDRNKNSSQSNSLVLIMMTDGIAKELDETKLDNFVDYINSNIEIDNFVLELETWVKSLSEHNGDDKTIMIYKQGV